MSGAPIDPLATDRPTNGPSSIALSRRTFLGGASRIAILLGLGVVTGGVFEGCVRPIGEGWSDGTFFDDGLGWIE